jgi:hypothetical protein
MEEIGTLTPEKNLEEKCCLFGILSRNLHAMLERPAGGVRPPA